MNTRYLIRPKADQDLDEQAFYLAERSSVEVAHRFLVAAHETFALLASQPLIGWKTHLRPAELSALRAFSVSGFDKTLVLYQPSKDGIDILRIIHGSRDLVALLRRESLE